MDSNVLGEEKERWQKFSKWLRKARRARGLTQTEAASKAGKTAQWWSWYERGNLARVETLKILAYCLELPLGVVLMQAGFSLESNQRDVVESQFLSLNEYAELLLAVRVATEILQLASEGKISSASLTQFLKEVR